MSESVYVTVKFCAVSVFGLYPVTILSATATAVLSPAFAYVTVYITLLLLIIFVNVSPYVPVTVAGFTAIFVT